GIAIVAAEIAHAIEEDVVPGSKTSNRKIIALRATLPCGKWLMPATLRRASRSVVVPCASNTWRGTTEIDCGVSMSGSVYFGKASGKTLVVTSTVVEGPATSTRTF